MKSTLRPFAPKTIFLALLAATIWFETLGQGNYIGSNEDTLVIECLHG